MTRTTVVCVGECMLELRPSGDSAFTFDFAGDTYNTAVYLRRVAREMRLDLDVAYLTGVGNDHYSDLMRQAWAREGVRDLSTVVRDGKPGLYAVENTAAGERRFTYWRLESAARAFLRRGAWVGDLNADLVYLSGITLQLQTSAGRSRLLDRLGQLRQTGGCVVAFDTNYRESCWPSRTEAVDALDGFVRSADIVFATLDDEIALRGPVTSEDAATRLAANGPREVVVKDGANGVWLWSDDRLRHLPAVRTDLVTDTTAAGDAFAGAYIAARLGAKTCEASAAVAAQVASVVIRHPGAIVPRHVSLLDPATAGGDAPGRPG